jgi:hypothetical protein
MFKECRFVKPNGLKCGSPALRGSPFCYFHARNRVYKPGRLPTGEKVFELPPLLSPENVHAALQAIFQALALGEIDSRRAGRLLYTVQLAQKNFETNPSLARNSTEFTRPPEC